MELGYKLHGHGKNKVVVMNDWFCDCSSYDSALPFLNQSDFQFAFVDLRGYGASEDIDGQYNLEEASQDLIDTADSLGWKDFHLVGYSMTGLVGQNILFRARTRIKSFIGICPVGASGMPGTDADFFQFMTEAAQDDDEKGMQIAEMLTSNSYSREWSAFRVKRWRKTSTARARVNYLKMFVFSNIVERLRNIVTPILVITGSEDIESLRKSALAEVFGSLYKNIEYLEIRGAGHSPMLEAPVALSTAINKFLEKHSGA